MPALPISDEQAASLVPLFPLFNDSEIARQTGLHRTTVGKCRAVWRAQELAKLASVSAYRAPPVEPEPPPTVDKWASCGPPARSPESCRYGEALARTHALDPLSKSGGIDKPPHGMFIHAMAAQPSWSSCSPQVRVAPLPPGVTAVGATIPSPTCAATRGRTYCPPLCCRCASCSATPTSMQRSPTCSLPAPGGCGSAVSMAPSTGSDVATARLGAAQATPLALCMVVAASHESALGWRLVPLSSTVAQCVARRT